MKPSPAYDFTPSKHRLTFVALVMALLGPWSSLSQAQALACTSSAEASTNTLGKFLSDAFGPTAVSSCTSGVSFSGQSSDRLIVSGSATASSGGGALTNTGILTVPAAEAISDVSVVYTNTGLGNDAFTRAIAGFLYEFSIVAPAGLPPGYSPGTTIPVLFTSDWDLEISGSGEFVGNAQVFLQHELGTPDSSGTGIGQSLVRQSLNGRAATFPPTIADVRGTCAFESTTCAGATMGFFDKTPFMLPLFPSTAYLINLTADARARPTIPTGATGSSSSNARAYIDPIIQIDPNYEFAQYFAIEYASGALEVEEAVEEMIAFDPVTGILSIPSVHVGGDTYVDVTLQLANPDDVTLEFLGGTQQLPPGPALASYDLASGVLTLPSVRVGSQTYIDVTLLEIGNFNFRLQSATPAP